MIQQKNINTGNVNTNGGDFRVGDNFYKSAEYQDFQKSISRLQRLIELTDDMVEKLEFSKELNELQAQLEAFKRDIIQLAETFQKINIDTDRLRLAKQHFDNGEYKAARAVLDAEQMTGELDALLGEKERLNEKATENTKHLKDKANEFYILAELTAFDYDLPNRYEQTKIYFQHSLSANRDAEILHNFADFLRVHNELDYSVELYEEVIEKYESLAEENPKYQKYVIGVLNDVAGVYNLQEKGDLAIEYMKKVIDLSKSDLYERANALNNLGILYEEKNELKKSEEFYLESLEITRALVSSDTESIYDVSKVLSNLAVHYQKSGETEKEEEAYKEAISILRDICETDIEKYLPKLANVLSNAANLQSRKKEYLDAEKAFKEALNIKEFLVSLNPEAYIPTLTQTQRNMCLFYCYDKPSKDKSVSFALKVIETSVKFKNMPFLEECSKVAVGVLKEWGIKGVDIYIENDV